MVLVLHGFGCIRSSNLKLLHFGEPATMVYPTTRSMVYPTCCFTNIGPARHKGSEKDVLINLK